MKKKFLTSFTTVFLGIGFIITPTAQAAEPLTEVKNIVKQVYYPGVSDKTLQQAKTIKQLMSKLDSYSEYLTSAQMKQFINSIEMNYVGVGVTVLTHTKGLKITEVVANSPAKKQGIQKGHIITKVNNKNLKGMKYEQAISLLTGKVNTNVTITVLNPKTNQTKSYTMKRQKLNVPNVETKRLAGGVGYIRLNSFASNSARDLQNHMAKLKDVNSWILDLRGNPGGDVEAAEKVIGMFKKAKCAYYIKFAKDKTYYYQPPVKQKKQFNGSVAVLVNQHSASASEMTAAAVKGQKLGTVYGQKTYGKGVQQGLFPLKNNKGYLKLTMAEFFGPTTGTGFTKIHRVGVTPNVKTVVGAEVQTSHKALLQKALAKNSVKTNSYVMSYNKQTMTVKPSKTLSWSKLKNAKVYVMQIGGTTQKVTIKKASHQLVIQPKTTLKKGSTYYVKIKPTTGKSTYTYMRVGN